MVKIFAKYFFCCENIFGPLLLIAHPLLPYIKPPPLVTPSSGIFEVKCDETKDELTDRTEHTMIVPFIVLDKLFCKKSKCIYIGWFVIMQCLRGIFISSDTKLKMEAAAMAISTPLYS